MFKQPFDAMVHDWRDAGGKGRPLPPPGGVKGPNAPRGPIGGPVPPPPPPAPPAVGTSRPTKDAATLDPGASTLAPTGKKALEAFAPAAGGETFSSKGLELPADAAAHPVMQSLEGDFALTAARAGGATTAVAVKANAAGDQVALGADGGLTLNGQPVPAGDAPRALPGGGTLTNWGNGFITVDTAGGDTVSAFAKGDRVDFMGQLSELR